MTEAEDGSTVRSVGRAIDILVALGQSPLALGEVARVVDLTKPTTYRLLTTLRAKGMVVQDPTTGQYGLGPGCFHLMSSLTSGNAGFIFEESNALEQLRDATSETVAVHVRAGRSRICVKELPSRNAIRYIAGVGIAEGIHTGSAGKVLLAYMPEAERERLLEDLPLPALTSTTITDVEALRTELRRVAAAGVAVSFGERVAGAVGVSAPITNRAGVALAALSVLGPADRLNRDRLPDIETRVRSVAKEISSTINAGAA